MERRPRRKRDESAGLGSEAGYTLHSEEPVIVEDVSTETRFEPI